MRTKIYKKTDTDLHIHMYYISCIYTYIHTYTHTYIHTYTVRTYTYIHTYVYVCVCPFVCVCVCVGEGAYARIRLIIYRYRMSLCGVILMRLHGLSGQQEIRSLRQPGTGSGVCCSRVTDSTCMHCLAYRAHSATHICRKAGKIE